ncbi:MAG: type II toxin-antitoxin system RelE/ParE family toxin [Saprospiraceae bacterium]
MILSFGDSETEKIWLGEFSAQLPTAIQSIARRKLRMLNSSQFLNDLRIPPGNRLEKLYGHLIGLHSIRINQQWRIVFQWYNGNALKVTIIDYH